MPKNKNELTPQGLKAQNRIVCEICGNPNNNLNFKGKKVCEDCVKYVKSY